MSDAVATSPALIVGNVKPRWRLGNLHFQRYGGHIRAFYEAAWRPANGWIATIACALHFVIGPLLNYWLVLKGHEAKIPPFDLGQTIALLALSLGMGGLRTFEKVYGVDTPAGQAQQVIVAVNQEARSA